MRQGRILVTRLSPSVRRAEDGSLQLLAPRPGLWMQGPLVGEPLGPGSFLGWLQVLGARFELRAPGGVAGRVSERAGGARPPAAVPVGFGEPLIRLDPRGLDGAAESEEALGASPREEGLLLRSPGSGRFYRRPAPDAEPFVRPGSELRAGITVGLLEIMKTFHRIDYEPDPARGLPDRARVVEVLLRDGEDVESGTPLLRLEPV